MYVTQLSAPPFGNLNRWINDAIARALGPARSWPLDMRIVVRDHDGTAKLAVGSGETGTGALRSASLTRPRLYKNADANGMLAMRHVVLSAPLPRSMFLAFGAALLVPGTATALNRQLEPIQPGIYSSEQEGGCDDPDSKDIFLIARSEIHLHEIHCRIRRIWAQGNFHEIDTDCESVGERGTIKYQIAPLYLRILAVQQRKGASSPQRESRFSIACVRLGGQAPKPMTTPVDGPMEVAR